MLGAAGIAATAFFLVTERRRASPMLPLGLFRSRALSVGTAVGLLFNLSLYGSLLCISLFLQQSRHESAAATGLLILPMSVVVGVGSLASGRLTARFGPRPPMIAGLGLAAAGAALIGTVNATTPLAVLLAGSLVLGMCSLAMPAMTAVVVGAAGRQHAGVASGVLTSPARPAGHWASRCSARCWQRPVAAPRSRSR
jgi:DHA2 family methylenomycin A resistance protein-like MFS transporter